MALLFTLALHVVVSPAATLGPRASISIQQAATSFNLSIGGFVGLGVPLAEPCYDNYNGIPVAPNTAQCAAVEAGYDNSFFIAENFGGYGNVNWGICQATGQRCVLNFSDPTAGAPANAACHQGSVPYGYFSPSSVSEVQEALTLADKAGIPLVVKNSGHDYKGRSSAPNSLALWMYPYTEPIQLTEEFTPEGCPAPVGAGVTVTAGQDFNGVYQFAEANNITVVGGSERTVGAAGGWLTGAGHSLLSNTMGLGVDNALQIRAVLPNGAYVTANRCQNQDIFFALRGGGGNAFGINMEVTYRAWPKVNLQVAEIVFVASSLDAYNNFFTVLTENANAWAGEGWGGYMFFGSGARTLCSILLFNPLLNNSAATASMAPVFAYINGSNSAKTITAGVFDGGSFFEAYQTFVAPNEEATGISTMMSSRLIPKALLATADSQAAVANALANVSNQLIFPTSPVNTDPLSLTYGAPLQIIATTPYSYVPPSYASLDDSSITPAWRDSTWHVLIESPFSNEASVSEINELFLNTHNAGNILRDLAPDSGAYQNEADVFEPDPIDTFWGRENYEKLVAIKKQVDPNNVMTCWGCIGWDPSDERYSCYPDIGVTPAAY